MKRKRLVLVASVVTLLAAALAFVLVKSQGAPRTSSAHITMMSDLKNLAMYQGFVKDSTGKYATTLEALDYTLSDGVRDLAITLTADGYTMSVGHRESSQKCVIFAGSTPIRPATRAGTPACTSSAP